MSSSALAQLYKAGDRASWLPPGQAIDCVFSEANSYLLLGVGDGAGSDCERIELTLHLDGDSPPRMGAPPAESVSAAYLRLAKLAWDRFYSTVSLFPPKQGATP